MHCGASSKILMAYLPEEEWDTIIAKEGLKRCTPNTITQVKKLKDHLREIRQRGWAYSDQEVDRDVRAVAAPVFNGLGMLVAGLIVVIGSSMGGDEFKLRDVLILAVVLVIFCALVFVIGLKLPIPMCPDLEWFQQFSLCRV